MIRCKVNDSTAHIEVTGTTAQLIKELLILNVCVMKDIFVRTKDGKIYSHAEKVMLIAEKLSNIALDIEEEREADGRK